jgi:hypothetical protein
LFPRTVTGVGKGRKIPDPLAVLTSDARGEGGGHERRGRIRQWSTSLVDVAEDRLLDVVEGRDAAPACAWLADLGPGWCGQIRYGTLDLSGSYRAVFGTMLPDAIQVAAPVHVHLLASQKLDEVRRRVQQETLGHRGRKSDPLYRARKLLVLAQERLDVPRQDKLVGLLSAGDPRGEVGTAWHAKEAVRELYAHSDPDLALAWVDHLSPDMRDRDYRPRRRGFDGATRQQPVIPYLFDADARRSVVSAARLDDSPPPAAEGATGSSTASGSRCRYRSR